MQKRPLNQSGTNADIELIYAPVKLDKDFPATGIGKHMHVPDSSPLTFLHYHDNLELGYCYGGSGIFIVDNKIMTFSKGDASIIFRNELHIAKSNPDAPSKWHFINLDPVSLLGTIGLKEMPKFFSFLDGIPDFENILKGETEPGLVIIIKEIIEEICSQGGMYTHAVKGLTLCLLARLSRVLREPVTNTHKSKHSSLIRISPALDMIFQNYTRQICVDDLAVSCNMSVTHFRRVFTYTMGISPKEYITKFKIQMSSVFITRTDMSILEVSLLLGYASVSSFNRHFKDIMGKSPREWRKQT